MVWCFTLLWGCGLKSDVVKNNLQGIVFHPLMRVWIEMSISTSVSGGAFVSPSYEGVDWNIVLNTVKKHFINVSPSYEGVDWNCECFWIKYCTKVVSPSYEGVDWNSRIKSSYAIGTVSPSYEGVDWNP